MSIRRFDYQSLTEHQLRIALGLLGIKERDVTSALEQAAQTAVDSAVDEARRAALAAFDLKDGAAVSSGARVVRPPAKIKSTGVGKGNSGNTKVAGGAPSSAKKPARKAGSVKSADAVTESRALQGRYIAAIRRVPKSKRAHYKALVASEGRGTAIERIDADYPKAQ